MPWRYSHPRDSAQINDQSLRNRLREKSKLGLRLGLHRADLSIARDPYVNRLSRALDYARIDTVLDIGANVGQFGRMLRDAGFAGDLISVEPLETAHRRLARRAGRDPRWHTLNVAVGESRSTAHINISENSFSSSLLTMTNRHLKAAPESRVIGSQVVEVTTVADLVRDRGLDPTKTLLKVDTQGFEKQVLDGAGDLVDQFAAVQLELSMEELYEGQLLFDDLVALLQAHGLRLWTLETGISDEHGQLLQCDGLFLRPQVARPSGL